MTINNDFYNKQQYSYKNSITIKQFSYKQNITLINNTITIKQLYTNKQRIFEIDSDNFSQNVL